ncbi:hypothetical protein ACHAP5_007629 [Fusarium lateritium]
MCLDLYWDSVRTLWVCHFENTQTGERFTHEAPIVVRAIGTLDRPFVPKFEGAESFQDDSLEVKNKNIVVLGNGASATQFVPELVKQFGPKGKVIQLVRSAHWWTKRGNPTYSSAFKFTMKYVPRAARIYRVLLAWELEKVFYSFLMTRNGARMRQAIRDTTNSYIENDAPTRCREILKPDYQPGCKRRVNTATYLAALHSPNMHLDKDSVTKIGPHHVVTARVMTYESDSIIYANGFIYQKWLYPMDIKGQNGKDLYEVWDSSGGAEAYKGTVVTGFPNFSILYGPNAATGQHSVIFHSECQINYTCRLLRPVLTGSSVLDYG